MDEVIASHFSSIKYVKYFLSLFEEKKIPVSLYNLSESQLNFFDEKVYDNNRAFWSVIFLNKHSEGIAINTAIDSLITYRKGVRNGYVRDKNIQGTYQEGKREGFFNLSSEVFTSFGFYEQDLQTGIWIYSYIENEDRFISPQTYKNGNRHGISLSRNRNATIFENYQNGFLHGYSEYYSSTGEIELFYRDLGCSHSLKISKIPFKLQKFEYKNNKKHGPAYIFQYFDENQLSNGKLITGNYLDDMRDGNWKTYDKDGNVIEEHFYICDIIVN